MKAFRVKMYNHILHGHRFEIVLCKNLIDQKLVFLLPENKARIKLELKNGVKLLVSLPCNKSQFEQFKIRWEAFKVNEDYYFDLSDWTVNN
jgi:hypothetical protein